MSDTERLALVRSIMPMPNNPAKISIPADAVLGAGYVQGNSRLGLPALKMTDASLGVAWALGARGSEGSTPLPSGLAQAATWDPELVRNAGAMIAVEARNKGFNVLLAGGINLVRDPRGGRNFEYFGEDPLLAGTLGGAAIAGIQSQHVMSTVKHFAFADQETARHFADVVIDDGAARESDLLAFQLAIEKGRPGSVLCAYNKVNADYACGNNWLLNDVLKRDWRYKGFVMSDWGAVYGLDFALKGLDHQSAAEIDTAPYFDGPLAKAVASEPSFQARLRDMARRVVYGMYEAGLDASAPAPAVDRKANEALAGKVAERGIVLLRNERNLLPLTANAKRILVVGGFADIGILSGGGSSQVHLDGGPAASIPGGSKGFFNGWEQYQRAVPPLSAIRTRAGSGATVAFRTGYYLSDVREQARQADIVIVFANQWTTEGRDVPDLSLPRGQDALIETVAGANPNTIVVLQNGSAVAMPWLAKVGAVVAAWYPGAQGGEAIARILFGDINPSGRLPITFPADLDQLPQPRLPGFDVANPDLNGKAEVGQHVTIDYNVEGSDVGYRWFARTHEKPLFPFGFGLSYTSFQTDSLVVRGNSATVQVRNTGNREGATVVQVYMTAQAGKAKQRLVAYQRVDLVAGQSQQVRLEIDPRLLANWRNGAWERPSGTYSFAIGESAEALKHKVTLRFAALVWKD